MRQRVALAFRTGTAGGIRTPVHRVRSAALCPLSYGGMSFLCVEEMVGVEGLAPSIFRL